MWWLFYYVVLVLLAASAHGDSPLWVSSVVQQSLTASVESLDAGRVSVSLVSDKVVSKTEPTYASWNIDSSCNRGFHHTNFTNPNLLAAARGLRPSRLRFGGSGNDYLVYGLSPASPECTGIAPSDCGYFTPGCLNATQWGNLHDFAVKSNADFIFGVSYGLEQACREGSMYQWNSSNAAVLLAHINSNGQHVWGFELGNEVNNNGGTPCNQTAEQQAAAQRTFSKMVQSKLPGAKFIGPDTGYQNWQDWLATYLPLVSDKAVPASQRLHAITHHVYAGIRRSNYNSTATLDGSSAEIEWYTSKLRELVPDAQIWAGEDGPIGGGNDGTCGQNSACGTYATTLWYADDLAKRAKHGFSQYQRQSLFGGHYGLTNSPSEEMILSPTDQLMLRPDYWTNFMWKRTLGTNVFNVSSSSSQVRAYGFSGNPPSPFAAPECSDNVRLQMLLINLDKDLAMVELPAVGSTYAAWKLAPPSDGPNSKSILLNDMPLPDRVDVSKRDPEAFLEKIPHAAVKNEVIAGLVLPSLSTSFVCIFGPGVTITL